MLSANGSSSGSGSGSGSSHSQAPSTRRLSKSGPELPSSDQKDGHQALRKSSSPPPKSPRAGHNTPPAKSRFTKFFRWLFSPFANFFITIYNLFFRRNPKPKALLDEDQEAKMENRGPAAGNINDRQTKENVNPRLNHAVANLTIRDAAAPVFPPMKSTNVPLVPVVPAGAPLKSVGILEEEDEDPARKAERAIHQGFIEEALDMVRIRFSFFLLSSSLILSCHAGLDVAPTRTGKLAMPDPVPLLYDQCCMSPWAHFDKLTVIELLCSVCPHLEVRRSPTALGCFKYFLMLTFFSP